MPYKSCLVVHGNEFWLSLLKDRYRIFPHWNPIAFFHTETVSVQCVLQLPEVIASFFSRLSWPTAGGSPPSASGGNVLGNVPSYRGREVEASFVSNWSIMLYHSLMNLKTFCDSYNNLVITILFLCPNNDEPIKVWSLPGLKSYNSAYSVYFN